MYQLASSRYVLHDNDDNEVNVFQWTLVWNSHPIIVTATFKYQSNSKKSGSIFLHAVVQQIMNVYVTFMTKKQQNIVKFVVNLNKSIFWWKTQEKVNIFHWTPSFETANPLFIKVTLKKNQRSSWNREFRFLTGSSLQIAHLNLSSWTGMLPCHWESKKQQDGALHCILWI